MVLTGWSRQRESTNIALLKMGKKRNKWGKMLKGMEKKMFKGIKKKKKKKNGACQL